MKIAQVAPLYEAVPPCYYGGTERIVHYLIEDLVAQGHDVTLFASADSQTSAKLVPICQRSLRLDTSCTDPIAFHFVQMEEVLSRYDQFDILHFHTGYLPFPLISRLKLKSLSTIHGRIDLREYLGVFSYYRKIPLVSISNNQRRPLPYHNWIGTIYHGIPLDLYHWNENPDRYMVFMGRISREKRLDRAIEIAKRVKIPLKIAAKIDSNDRRYFEQEIAPLLNHRLIEFIGEVGEKEKEVLLKNALCLLFPIDWPEPFGIVMIESMACGTPVIGFRQGSVPEVIEHGINGFIVDDIYEAVNAIRKIDQISRQTVRQYFENNFNSSLMASRYLELYHHVLSTKKQRIDEMAS